MQIRNDTVKGDKEGVPTFLMESMAKGLSVISAYHSALPELINNGSNGFLVKERDVSSYTEAMLNLKNVTNEIGLNAYEKVAEDFNLNIETQKLFGIYDRLISNVME